MLLFLMFVTAVCVIFFFMKSVVLFLKIITEKKWKFYKVSP